MIHPIHLMGEKTKEAVRYVKEHPELLQKYFIVRATVFAISMGVFQNEFKVDALMHFNQQFAGLILFPFAVIGILGIWKRSYPLNMTFIGGFFMWNTFLISQFLTHGAYNYVGLYAFTVDIFFTTCLLKIIHTQREYRKNGHDS